MHKVKNNLYKVNKYIVVCYFISFKYISYTITVWIYGAKSKVVTIVLFILFYAFKLFWMELTASINDRNIKDKHYVRIKEIHSRTDDLFL